MPIIFSLRNEHFSGFKIYTYTGQVCRKAVSLFVAKNISLLLKKGKLESHVLYLCTCQDCQKYPSTKCTRMYIFLFHEKVKNT
jgi:hypothetical protein